ncbi:protein RGF1 INDUCIBLE TRANSCRIPTION FACTOR 1-like [Cornus florida]|uniref:protein RGF1 INDUCIBLE TRANSCRIPTION FACTOR 1-like n=1 Tax=Cornus florida TaxID=4283 RepID=UPI0028A222E7|nr:protein RGF1 INDUCIBLE TRANSCRIPTION FACTOR 1-like [Cornus florida]
MKEGRSTDEDLQPAETNFLKSQLTGMLLNGLSAGCFFFQVGLTSIPQWLEVLFGEKFFNSCLVHESQKKNEKNTFCLDCCTCLCPHCLPPHQNHHLLQVRRYVYQDVIRLNDAQKLIDCSFVQLMQSYTTNNSKVVFLQQRPITRQFKGSGNLCIMCSRNLQDPYLFCSLSCKVHHMGGDKVGVMKQHLCNFELDGPRLENVQMTPESVLELPISLGFSSGSSSNSVSSLNCRTFSCTATTEFVKKKRSSISACRTRYRLKCSKAMEFGVSLNRRKGVPHRSPLY